jgi:hypothetical protein
VIQDYYIYYYLFSILTFINLSLLFILNFHAEDNKKFLYALLIVFLESILIGIRADNIGIDSHQYAEIYSGNYDREGIEPVFLFIKFLFNWLTTDYSFFFMLMSFSINLFIFFAFKNLTKDYVLAFAIFLSTFLFINMQINIMRQALAIAIVFYGISCLVHNQNKKFWFLMLVATLTHYTAILFSILFFLRKIEVTKKKVIIIMIFILLIYNFTLSDLLFYIQGYHPYLERVYYYFNWGMLTPWKIKHIYYLVLILILVLYLNINKLDEVNKKLFLFYLYGLILLVLFKEEEMVADRFFYYFIFIGIILILSLRKLIKQKNIFYLGLYFSIIIWYIKTVYLQFPAWFLPPFEAIRTM